MKQDRVYSGMSIRTSLGAVMVIIVLFFGVIALNRVLTVQSEKAEANLRAISDARDTFYSLVLSENIALYVPSNFKDVSNKMSLLNMKCSRCHQNRQYSILDERKKQFDNLYGITRASENSYFQVRDNFLDLLASVKYIHQHHLTYMRNLLRHGELYTLSAPKGNFTRDSSKSASEIDILEAATSIRTSLFDTFGIFHAMESGRQIFEVEKAFKARIGEFYTAVNAFEDFSLDAQDGLLVEELLSMGRGFEESFENLLFMEGQKKDLESQLKKKNDELTVLLASISESITQSFGKGKERIRFLQLIALVFAALLAVLNIFFGRQVLEETQRIVEETLRIGQDAAYRIPEGKRTFKEFALVYRTLNSMALKIGDNLARLEKAREDLEVRVEERTRELRLANRQLTEEMADRKRVQQDLAESEERLKNIVDNINAGIIIVDAQSGEIVSANPFARRLLAPDGRNLAGNKWRDHQTDCGAGEVQISMQGAGGREQVLLDTQGNSITVLSTAIPFHLKGKRHMLESFIDLRQLKEAQEKRRELEMQLERSRKMEAIGTLAGGIAHDFNNILGAIIGYSELASFDLPEEHSARAHLNEVLKASDRAKKIIRQILAFSRRSEPEQRLVRMEKLIDEVLTLIRASFPSTIEIRKQILCANDRVLADSNQMHQVLMNLLTNAGHAAPENTGIIEIRLESVDVNDQEWAARHSVSPGPFLKLSVSDNGQGMDEATQRRIFDPYFTTKEKGKGTGMGLAVVEGVVTSHFGAITVASAPMQGSTFSVWLPAIGEGEEKEATDKPSLERGSESILFVDDEEALALYGQRILSVLGYKVLACTSPLQALDIFRNSPHGFDLVVTDMTMPGLTGDKLFQEIRSIRPDIPVILCTGFSKSINRARAAELGINKLLMKPLRTWDLARAIRDALEGKAS